MSNDLSLQEAADRLGVHYMTAYRYVRTGQLPATLVGARWRVPRSAIKNHIAALRSPAQPRRRATARHDSVAQLRRLLIVGDERESWRLVQSCLASSFTPESLYFNVLAPTMRRIGADWAADRIDVGAEHQATVVMYRLIGRLGPLFSRPGPPRGAVVVGAPPEDTHGLPTALLADPLRGRGFAVIDIGANPPLESWRSTVESSEDASGGLCGVAIAASSPANRIVLRDTIAAIKRVTSSPVILGGPAIRDHAHAIRLGADRWVRSAESVVQLFDRMDA